MFNENNSRTHIQVNISQFNEHTYDPHTHTHIRCDERKSIYNFIISTGTATNMYTKTYINAIQPSKNRALCINTVVKMFLTLTFVHYI